MENKSDGEKGLLMDRRIAEVSVSFLHSALRSFFQFKLNLSMPPNTGIVKTD